MDWPKRISVDKRIVQVLSGNTYENFPKATRELVMNSFDADATEVRIDIDESQQSISILDNGTGMNETDLDLYFRIAGRRREKTPCTKSGRMIVGQFGVGFLAVFPFCREFRIESKRKGDAQGVFASIPTARYFTSDSRLLDVSDIEIEGGAIAISSTDREKSYTLIEMKGFTPLTKAFFSKDNGVHKRKNSIRNYDGLERLIWNLEEDLPLQFEDEAIEAIMQSSDGAPLKVFVNGRELLRRTYGKSVLDKHRGQFQVFGRIKYRYVILTNYRPVSPEEARFLKMRNLNVGVGERTTFGVGPTGPRSRLQHLSGEIHVLEGLNELLAVSRDQFNYSPDYENMKEFFAGKLRRLSAQLEALHDLDSLSPKGSPARISSVKLLDPLKMRRMAKRLENSGYSVVSSPSRGKNAGVTVDRENKVISVPQALDELYGRIEIMGTTYALRLDSWNWQLESLFPACRVEDKTVVINRAYPLFKQRKYTDVFVKLHVLLIEEYEKGTLPQNAYQSIISNLLTYFSDYVKE